MEKELMMKLLDELDLENTLAVYLTGSHLNNLNTAESDYDFIVVEKTERRNLFNGKFRPTVKVGDEFDYKVYSLQYFLGRLVSPSFNEVEMLNKFPLYHTHEFTEMAEFLYDKRNWLLNKQAFLEALSGELTQIYNKVTNKSGKVNMDKLKLGKDLAKYQKLKTQALYLLENNELYVEFNEKEREKVVNLRVKKNHEITEEELDEVRNDNFVEELYELATNMEPSVVGVGFAKILAKMMLSYLR